MEGMKDLFDHTLLNLSLTHSGGTLTSQFGLSCSSNIFIATLESYNAGP